MGAPFFGSIDMTISGNSVTAACTIFTCLPTGSSGRMYYLTISDGIYNYQTLSTFAEATIFLDWTVTNLEPSLDYTFTISADEGSDTKTQRSPQGSSVPYEMSPRFYPTVLHQWIIYDNNWYSQAGTCVACALVSLKEYQEYLEGKGRQKYSIGWIFGNRLTSDNQDEGLNTGQALNRLLADGSPPWNIIPENSRRTWPDNYTYFDANGLTGAKNMVSNIYSSVVDFARPQRISNWYKINSWTMTQLREIIYNKGYLLVGVDLYDNFYQAETNGGIIPTPHSGNYRAGHNMLIIGWKYINGIFYWICQNSWGNWVGDSGIFYLPATNNFCQGFWDITDGSYPITAKLATPSLKSGYPTTTGSTIYFQLNPVIGAESYRVQCDAPDGSYVDQSFTSTTINLTGKTAGTTYTIRVKAVSAGALDSDYLTFYATTVKVAVSPPTLISYNNQSVNGDWAQISWSKPNYANTYWVYYKRRSDSVWTSTTNWHAYSDQVTATFTGLTPGVLYDFGIRGVYDSSNFSEMSTVAFTPWYMKPYAFSWDNPKTSGGSYNVTANEWNRLINTITQLYRYKGWSLSAYPMTTVSPGNTFYYSYFKQVRDAIGSKQATGIQDRTGVVRVLAAELNTLVSTLNSLINAA